MSQTYQWIYRFVGLPVSTAVTVWDAAGAVAGTGTTDESGALEVQLTEGRYFANNARGTKAVEPVSRYEPASSSSGGTIADASIADVKIAANAAIAASKLDATTMAATYAKVDTAATTQILAGGAANLRATPPASVLYMGERLRLPRSKGISGTNNAGVVVNLLSTGDSNLSPNPYPQGQMYIGDPSLDYCTFLTTIDAGSGNVIDMRYVGNLEAALDTRLIQGLDYTVSGYDTRTVGIATRAVGTVGNTLGTGILDRMVVSSGLVTDSSYVKVRNARFQLVADTGLTKVLQVFASNGTTELAAIDSTGHLKLTPSGASVNHIETWYGGALQFYVTVDGTWIGIGDGAASTSVRVGAIGTASQPCVMFGQDTRIQRLGANRLALNVASTFTTGLNVTGSRPSAVTVAAGAQFYDTSLSKPIWSDGTNWKDAAGATV